MPHPSAPVPSILESINYSEMTARGMWSSLEQFPQGQRGGGDSYSLHHVFLYMVLLLVSVYSMWVIRLLLDLIKVTFMEVHTA